MEKSLKNYKRFKLSNLATIFGGGVDDPITEKKKLKLPGQGVGDEQDSN